MKIRDIVPYHQQLDREDFVVLVACDWMNQGTTILRSAAPQWTIIILYALSASNPAPNPAKGWVLVSFIYSLCWTTLTGELTPALPFTR